MGPILFAAREHGDDDELIEAFVLLLRQIESLQHFDVLQFVRVGFPTRYVVLKRRQDLV